ncbi:EF-P lysine aminoacylase EpmA [Marinobacterium litorale]|uniref:EF-P lysine aminoacylase EpmA n=1 Tax=Marinobacterium litorale TaxID=404770 RepID=UPI0004045611|nr:EF-P lysine aminoacylase EpmA [Marinobacterium litorale]
MTIENDWHPSAPIANLQARARLLAQVRQFFAERKVMEVDTQLLSQAAVSDPFIESFEAIYRPSPEQQGVALYLQTSPEYAMKRLLAAGSGPIYQLGKVFRNGERGRRHNPEFTMLEWYRPGYSANQLMDEVEQLVLQTLQADQIERISYRDLFVKYLALDPHVVPTDILRALCRSRLGVEFEDDSRDTWLELLMSHLIEPQLQQPVFVHSFPSTQAALAQVVTDERGVEVATRFELYMGGVELANGYQELTDADEQARRLQVDQARRQALGLPQRPLEQRLVAALKATMPECSGVALGFDRLLMLALGVDSIDQVIAFPFERA